jgi:hypothetical protein
MEAKDFFPKVRRELDIQDFHVLRSTGSERRVKVNMRMPIGGQQSIIGVPEEVLNARESVMKDRGVQRKVIFELEIEGAAMEFFTTPEAKRRTQMFTGTTLKQFSVERVGKDEKAAVYLNFIAYSPCSEESVVWLYQHLHDSSFAEFDATQATFTYDGEDKEDEDDGQTELPLSDGKTAKLTIVDPNDDPKEPIPNDKRQAIKPTDKPSARSAKKKKK